MEYETNTKRIDKLNAKKNKNSNPYSSKHVRNTEKLKEQKQCQSNNTNKTQQKHVGVSNTNGTQNIKKKEKKK